MECPACGHVVSFWKRSVDGVIVLDALNGPVLIAEEIETLYDAVVPADAAPRVVVNLDQLDFVTSGFLAAMLTLRKCVEGRGGRLALCRLQPVVQTIFHRTNLDLLFSIFDSEPDAVAAVSEEESP
jgi:anti-anti-sigma factor